MMAVIAYFLPLYYLGEEICPPSNRRFSVSAKSGFVGSSARLVGGKPTIKSLLSSRMVNMIKDNIVFLREFISEFQTTGAAFPTSRRAAEELTRPLAIPRGPQQILELGPGTGSVTTRIIEQMHDDDHLTICEINPRFMEALQKRLAPLPRYQQLKNRIRFFLGPAQDLPEDSRYDVVVCALPFLNFDVTTVEQIFDKLERVVNQPSVMTYYEFIGLRRLGKSSVAPPVMRKRIREVDSYFSSIFQRKTAARRRVWFNMLPINVYTLKFAA